MKFFYRFIGLLSIKKVKRENKSTKPSKHIGTIFSIRFALNCTHFYVQLPCAHKFVFSFSFCAVAFSVFAALCPLCCLHASCSIKQRRKKNSVKEKKWKKKKFNASKVTKYVQLWARSHNALALCLNTHKIGCVALVKCEYTETRVSPCTSRERNANCVHLELRAYLRIFNHILISRTHLIQMQLPFVMCIVCLCAQFSFGIFFLLRRTRTRSMDGC